MNPQHWEVAPLITQLSQVRIVVNLLNDSSFGYLPP